MTILHNRLEQLTNESKASFSSWDQRIADLEGKDLMNEASMDRIRQQLQVLEAMGQATESRGPSEPVLADLNAARDEQDRATRSALERIAALEKVTKKLRIRDEQIQTELNYAHDNNIEGQGKAGPLGQGRGSDGQARRTIHFQDDGTGFPSGSQTGRFHHQHTRNWSQWWWTRANIRVWVGGTILQG